MTLINNDLKLGDSDCQVLEDMLRLYLYTLFYTPWVCS